MKRTVWMSLAASLVCATVLEAAPIHIAARKPLTHEVMWMMKRVGAPVPSPDGKWVVFSVTDPSYDEKEQTSDLWIVPADGIAPPRRLTATKAAESDVVWSPDSHRIVFSTKREGDEVNQIYLLDVIGGGEAQRVTTLSTGARSPHFRPDGKAILFTSSVYPGAADDEANKKIAKERKEQKYKVRVYDQFPIRNWDRWMDDLQPHIFVQALDVEKAPARDVLAGTQLVAQPGFAGRSGGESGREDIEAIWAPDGQAILFVATTKRNTAAYAEVPADIYRLDLTTDGRSEPKVMTGGTGDYGRLKFSPDGKELYSTYSPNNGLPFNNARLVRFDWPGSMQPAPVTAAFDRSVDGYVIAPDSKTIYLTAEDAGLVKVYAVPAAGGEVKQAVDQEAGVFTGLSIASNASSTVLIANWGSSINPPEVVRIDLGARASRNLTDFNSSQVTGIDWLPPRHFWFTNKDGMKIHNMIVVPAAFDETKKYPLLVLIHGGAASMWRDQISLRWNYHLLAKPAYVLLMTDYRGSTGYGDKFGQAIQGDPLRGPGDDLNAAADEAIKRFPFIDGTRQAAAGASYGGHLANWLEATTTRYKCLISHAGLVNLESQWGTSDGIYHRELMAGGPVWEQNQVWRTQNPIRYAAHFKTPILLSVGEHDFRVPMNETLENWSALQRMKVPSRLLVWPDENHWILNAENSRYFYKEVADWLAKWLS
jgi:dipeptidyl aminopeptidase/acylaminoacyl peptidase